VTERCVSASFIEPISCLFASFILGIYMLNICTYYIFIIGIGCILLREMIWRSERL
jgi:hypothetical protein